MNMKRVLLATALATFVAAPAVAGDCDHGASYVHVVVDEGSLARASPDAREFLEKIPACWDSDTRRLHFIGIVETYDYSRVDGGRYLYDFSDLVGSEAVFGVKPEDPKRILAYVF